MALDVWSEFKEQVRVQTDIVSLIGETRNVDSQARGTRIRSAVPVSRRSQPFDDD
ncbi:MAG: hypothetical protein R3C12_21800 [Planctomycetaceae bacterium]